jgi:hypothetical protein
MQYLPFGCLIICLAIFIWFCKRLLLTLPMQKQGFCGSRKFLLLS